MAMAVGLAIAGSAVVAWVIGFVLVRGLGGVFGYNYDELLASDGGDALLWPFVAAVALMVIIYFGAIMLMDIGSVALKRMERACQRAGWL